MSAGSSNHWPDLPWLAAWVSTVTCSPNCSVWPEVSTCPPLPVPAPLASMRPPTCVTLLAFFTSLHNTTLPPTPWLVALASMLAPCAMATCVAWRMSPLPCQSPPTNTVPPPVAPLASILLVLDSTILSPISTILPPLLVRLVALSWPLFLTTAPCRLANAWADKIICPPSASTALRFSTKAAMVCAVVVMPAKPVPPLLKVSAIVSADAKATVPACATTTPWLRTSGASKAM